MAFEMSFDGHEVGFPALNSVSDRCVICLMSGSEVVVSFTLLVSSDWTLLAHLLCF